MSDTELITQDYLHPTPNYERKAHAFAEHLAKVLDVKKAALLAGYSPTSVKNNVMMWWRDPNSPLRRAVRDLQDAQLDLVALKADEATHKFVNVASNIAQHVNNLPPEEQVKVVSKIGNAIECARKNGSRRFDDNVTTIQHTNFQIAVSQMYINPMGNTPKAISHDDD